MKRYTEHSCSCDMPHRPFSSGTFYSLFFGLGDPCTGQHIPLTQALSFVREVCARCFVNGYTILEGCGANRGTPEKTEPSIYIMAINADESTVFQAASIFQKHFHQSEVLIEQNKAQYLYFQ